MIDAIDLQTISDENDNLPCNITTKIHEIRLNIN